MSDNLPDVAEMVKNLRHEAQEDTRISAMMRQENSRRLLMRRAQVSLDAATLLESLSARVTQAETEKAEQWVESTEYAYGSLDAPDIISPTGEDIDDLGTAQWHAEEFWLDVLERTVRRSPWRFVSSPGTGNEASDG